MRYATPLFALLLAAAPAFAGDEAKPARGHGEHRREILAKFDANHDGKLDDGEKAAARAALAAKLAEKHPKLLAKIDSDGDGVLSQAEMKAARAALKERRAKRADAK